MNTDPIADYLTRIRNAQMARHKVVEIPASNLKKEITKILHDAGYILNFKFEDGNIERISTPGLRKYVGVEELPRVLNGLGIAVVSTPKGVMTDKTARKENVGGEVLCYVY